MSDLRNLGLFLPVAFAALHVTVAQAQSGFSLDDLDGGAPTAMSPAERLSACLADASACSQAPRRSFSLDDVVNLGIVDRGQTPAHGSQTRSLESSSDADAPILDLTVLPSIDISAYLSGETPARSHRRSTELEQLADVLSTSVPSDLGIVLVVSGPEATEATGRASEIAQALEAALGRAVTVRTETAEIDGLTLALVPSGPSRP